MARTTLTPPRRSEAPVWLGLLLVAVGVGLSLGPAAALVAGGLLLVGVWLAAGWLRR